MKAPRRAVLCIAVVDVAAVASVGVAVGRPVETLAVAAAAAVAVAAHLRVLGGARRSARSLDPYALPAEQAGQVAELRARLEADPSFSGADFAYAVARLDAEPVVTWRQVNPTHAQVRMFRSSNGSVTFVRRGEVPCRFCIDGVTAQKAACEACPPGRKITERDRDAAVSVYNCDAAGAGL